MSSTPTTIEDIANSISHLLGVPAAVVLVAGSLALVLWASVRTRSFHLLRMRAWRLLYGKRVAGDPDLQRLEAEVDALLEFRMVTGIKARTWFNAAGAIDWMRRHNENPLDIGACGASFDSETCRIIHSKVPGKGVSCVLGFFCSALILAAVASGLTTVSPGLIYRTNATGIWFSMTKDRIKPIGKSGVIDAHGCLTDHGAAAAAIGFNEEEAKALCDVFADSSQGQSFEDALTSQRHAGMVLLAFFAAYAWGVGLALRTTFVARAVGDRVLEGPPPPTDVAKRKRTRQQPQ